MGLSDTTLELGSFEIDSYTSFHNISIGFIPDMLIVQIGIEHVKIINAPGKLFPSVMIGRQKIVFASTANLK